MSELKVSVAIDSDVAGQSDVDSLIASLDRLGKEARQAGSEAKAAGAGVDSVGDAARRAAAHALPAQEQIRKSVRTISDELRLLAGAYAAVQGGGALLGAAAELGKIADAAKNLQARLSLVVGEGPKLQAALAGVEAVALRTSTALESTGTLFGKIADAGKTMGIGTAEALALTETINQAIQLSGASAQASEAAVTQLIQGLQSGVLRGDEFNSIMEQAPRLSKAMAEGLGRTTGGLRELAEAGALSSETVIKALQGQAATIEREFTKLPPTIGRALTNLSTHWSQFISQSDEASGASAKAAAVIETLARNLDLIAAALINSGQAWLGWKAYNIAAEFLGLRAAVLGAATATGVATAATVANTTATAANTAAQVANAEARAGAAASSATLAGATGKLAGALSLLKGFSLAFLLTNLKDVGDWIAKTAYGLTDLAKRNAELERAEASAADAQRQAASAAAEDAAKKKMAADAAFGLSKRVSELVQEFDEQIKKGAAAEEAMSKLAKALDLSDAKGINEAGAALDDLARKGRLSADQVSKAWQQALSGKDLRIFAIEAEAAFDGADQGQRRLAAALEAVLGEAIRRTGKDLQELTSGIGAGAQRSINDYDTLLARLEEIRAKGLDVGETLASSLDQAAKAATTEQAMAEVVRRWEELGKQGLLAGERLRRGLADARDKLDELKPGITSVAEAFKALGLHSQAELQRTAATAQEAYETILRAGTATPAQLEQAFRRYAETVIAANGGVASDVLKVQAAMRGLTIDVDETGRAIVRNFDQRHPKEFGDAVAGVTGKVRALREEVERRPASLSGRFDGQIDRRGGISGNLDLRDTSRERTVEELKAANFTAREIQDYYDQRRTSQADQAAGLIQRSVSTQAIDAEFIARSKGLTGPAVRAFVEAFGDSFAEEMAAMRAKLAGVAAIGTEGYLREYAGAFERAVQRTLDTALTAGRRVGETSAEAPAAGGVAAPASVHRVEIRLGGKTTAIDTSHPDAATALIGVLKDLQGRAA